MKTIELNCGGTKAQFTTKSVTYNGVEYFYSKMTNISHNENLNIYAFIYNDKVIKLPYEEKDSKILAAIFGQVKMLLAKKAAAQTETAEEKKPDTPSCDNVLPAKSGGNTLKDSVSIRNESNTERPASTESGTEAKASAPADQKTKTPEPTDQKAKTPAPADQKTNTPAPTGLKAKATGLLKKREKMPSFSDKSENIQKASPADPEKKLKMKKAFIIFGIIIVICAAAAAITHAVFGSPDSASQVVPNATESQQYDDIDDIINDLQ